jgi:lipopolysaccharide transport system ATP-binding protein
MNSYICANNIRVEFPIFNTPHRSLKKTFLRVATGGKIASDSGGHLTIRALDDVSFEIKEGDRVGLVGHNGSGKTTLLRVLSGVYEPVEGSLEVRGRIASLLDISVGMDNEGTGYENIFLRGLLLGLSKLEIKRKLDEISEFSELGDYLDMPIRTYSSGMVMRLAFSISTNVDADILLMDEWLSVGDESFTKKAEARLNELVQKSAILVMASHSQELLGKVCNRILHLEHGKLIDATNSSKP